MVSDVSCEIDVTTDERISQGKVKGVVELVVFDSNQIIEAFRVLRSFEMLLTELTNSLANLVQANDTASTQTMLTQVVNAGFTLFNGVADDVIEICAGS